MKAETLLKKLENLQWEIYKYSSDLKEKASKCNDGEYLYNAAELVGESGFELDVAKTKMQDAIDILKA